MVFDKKGNIVSVDVPRPSSPELKKMLENEEKIAIETDNVKSTLLLMVFLAACTGVWADTGTILIKGGSGRI